MNILKMNFRNILGATAVASMLFLGATTFTSCGKQGCTDPEANNYDVDATDDDGSCTFDRTAFIGTYNVSESCTSGNYTYSMTVAEASANKVTVTLTNLGDFQSTVLNATVSGTSLTIPSQSVTVNGTTIQISGQGTLNNTTLTIIYTATYNGTSDNCTATCLKQ